MSAITIPCSSCGAVPPLGAGLVYLNGWGYCPRCLPGGTTWSEGKVTPHEPDLHKTIETMNCGHPMLHLAYSCADCYAAAIEAAEVRGARLGIEGCAKACDERSASHAEYSAKQPHADYAERDANYAIEANLCAHEIRAIDPAVLVRAAAEGGSK